MIRVYVVVVLMLALAFCLFQIGMRLIGLHSDLLGLIGGVCIVAIPVVAVEGALWTKREIQKLHKRQSDESAN